MVAGAGKTIIATALSCSTIGFTSATLATNAVVTHIKVKLLFQLQRFVVLDIFTPQFTLMNKKCSLASLAIITFNFNKREFKLFRE